MTRIKKIAIMCIVTVITLGGCTTAKDNNSEYSSVTETTIVTTADTTESTDISSESEAESEFITDTVDMDKIKSMSTGTYTDSVGNSYYVISSDDANSFLLFSTISDTSNKEDTVESIALGIVECITNYGVKTNFSLAMGINFVGGDKQIVTSCNYYASSEVVGGEIRWCNEEYKKIYNDSALKETVDKLLNIS